MRSNQRTVKTVCSDLSFLFQTARRQGGTLIGDTIGVIGSTVLLHLMSLAAVPLAVGVLTSSLPRRQAIFLAVAITLILCGLTVLERLMNSRFEQSRDAFRTRGCTTLARYAVTRIGTDEAYPHRLRAAYQAMGKHIHAPIPHVWYAFAQWMIHAIGLIVTVAVLVYVHFGTAWIVMATALVGAVVHRTVTVLGMRDHAAEEIGADRLSWLAEAAGSPVYAKDIRVFGLDAWIRELFDRTLNAVQSIANHRAKIYAWFSVADALLTAVRGGVAVAVSMDAVWNGDVSLPVWLLWLLCVGGCAQSVGGLLTNSAALRRELPSVTAYRTLLSETDPFVTEGGVLPKAGPLHTLELRHVSVIDPRGEHKLLNDVTLTLHKGERLAVVGEDGAWKDALTGVLCGLCDPTDGAVLLDGVDVRELDRRAYYALLSTVMPGGALPEMTVRDMLTTAVDASEESVLWEALTRVGMDQTVRAWPHGLDTFIGHTLKDGVSLSGGEKTRLLLARALCKDGELLVLDEPTAALDPLAEHALYQQYDRLTAGKSAVFLSHRAAMSRCCDRIVYIRNGAVAEEGTHEELLARGGDYAALFELQSRYYREGRDPS